MFVLSLLSKAALLSTDERVHQKIAMSRDFGDAMQKLFVEPSKPDETDRWNSITRPNLSRPLEGPTRMLGLPQPQEKTFFLQRWAILSHFEHVWGSGCKNISVKLIQTFRHLLERECHI